MTVRTKTAVAAEVGQRIDAHLRRFEADPEINPGRRFDKKEKARVLDPMGVKDYYCARACGDRHRVWVIYVSYQGGDHLSVEDATAYLSWLDAGNVGTHHTALRRVPR